MDQGILADARGDPGVPANDYSIAWSARGNARAHARRLQRQAQHNQGFQVVPQHGVSFRARRLVAGPRRRGASPVGRVTQDGLVGAALRALRLFEPATTSQVMAWAYPRK